jgi:iron complex outermembrane receptor protein
MARAPDVSGNVGIDYEIANGEGGVLLSTNANYTDSYVVNNASLFGRGPNADKQRYRQSSYVLVNASATWTDQSGRFHIGAYGRNLTDKDYRITYTGGGFGDYGSPAEPRTYGVRAGVQF